MPEAPPAPEDSSTASPGEPSATVTETATATATATVTETVESPPSEPPPCGTKARPCITAPSDPTMEVMGIGLGLVLLLLAGLVTAQLRRPS